MPRENSVKSTLWTHAGVDQNFRRLGAIGLCKWNNPLVPCFQGKSVWTNRAESLPKVSPKTGIGPWMVLPRNCQNFMVQNLAKFVLTLFSVAMPADSRCEKMFEIAFEIAGAKL